MTQKSQLISSFYLVLSLLGLILCLKETSHYMSLNLGYMEANIKFWSDAMINHASRSITWDIVIMYFCASTFMIVESRRLKMKFSWVYIVMGYLVAIAFTFPLFMFFRQRKLNSDH